MKYTCYSGGAKGSDSYFEYESIKNNIDVVAFSFDGHDTETENVYILNKNQLKEGFKHIEIANLRLKRNINNLPKYIKNLISRDWFQVKMSDCIFAVGYLDVDNNVKGGTGYAIACAIDNKKPIYLFEQSSIIWYYYNYNTNNFDIFEGIPILTKKFAGIGTRDINKYGINAIKELFKVFK